MNRLLLFFLLLFTLPAIGPAQNGLILREKNGPKSLTLTPGDWVKVKIVQGNRVHSYAGKFKTVENGMLCLRRNRMIPLDQIDSIETWPPDVKGLFWVLLIAGIVLFAIGLLTFSVAHSLGASTKGPGAYLIVGLCFLVVSSAASQLSKQKADRLQTDWTTEIFTMPPAAENPGIIP